MAAAATEKAFIVCGHGEEDLLNLEERPVMPIGYTLVLFAECGAVSYLERTVSKTVNAFLDESNAEAILYPTKSRLKDLLGSDVHIFRAGDHYPKLKTSLFLDWGISEDRGKQLVVKSGLYSFPLEGNASDYLKQTTVDTDTGTARIFKDQSQIEKLYEHAIYPTNKEIDTIFKTRYGSIMGIVRHPFIKVTLEKLFEVGGPGVYYWPVCRSIEDSPDLTNYLDTLDSAIRKSSNNVTRKTLHTIKERYLPYIYTWMDHHSLIKSMMNADAANDRIAPETKEKLQRKMHKMGLNEFREKIYKVRRNSISAQSMRNGGGFRKTRGIRKLRKTRMSGTRKLRKNF